MSDHAALRVRDLAAAELSGLPITGNNVFVGRSSGHKFKENQLPCLNIRFAEDLQVEDHSSPEDVKTSDAMLHIEIRAQVMASEDLEAALLAIRAEVEECLEGNNDLNGQILWLEFEGYESELEDENKRIGLGRCYLRCRYMRAIGSRDLIPAEAV